MSDFGLELILAEERARERAVEQPSITAQSVDTETRYDRQTVTIERKNFEAPSPFTIGDDTRSFPIYGNGTVESLLLITDSPDYSITVALDTPSDIVGADESAFLQDEDYDDLRAISTEMQSVAAFQAENGNYVLNVGPVEFLDNVRAMVSPDGNLGVLRQRAEVTIEQEIQ